VSVLSRRLLLQSGVAFASWRAWGEDRLRGDEVLPDPDFSRLHEKTPHLVGVRPHRMGGSSSRRLPSAASAWCTTTVTAAEASR
jgi:hypothetical protein